MAKALGKDIKEFWHNHWPVGKYAADLYEDIRFDDNGDPFLEDDVEYDLDRLGYFFFNGPPGAREKEEGPFSKFFLKWYKKQTTTTILVTVSNNSLDAAVATIKQALPEANITV